LAGAVPDHHECNQIVVKEEEIETDAGNLAKRENHSHVTLVDTVVDVGIFVANRCPEESGNLVVQSTVPRNSCRIGYAVAAVHTINPPGRDYTKTTHVTLASFRDIPVSSLISRRLRSAPLGSVTGRHNNAANV